MDRCKALLLVGDSLTEASADRYFKQFHEEWREDSDSFLRRLTMDEKVERSTGRSLLKGWVKKNIDNEAKRKVKQFVTGSLRKEGMRLPTLWASQTEVKKELYGARALHERRVYRQSVNRARRPSKSCKMFTNWNLDREKVREILK